MRVIIKKHISDLFKDPFWKNNSIFFVGSMLVAALNYLYYPVMGRVLGVAEFGELQLLLSLFNQSAIILAAFNLVAIINTTSKREQRNNIELERFALSFMFLITLATLFLAPLLGSFFKFASFLPFTILAISLVVITLNTFKKSFVQAKNKFSKVSLAGVIGSFAKIVLSLLLVWLGYGVSGAIGGVFAANVIAYIYIRQIAKKGGLRIEKFKMPDLAVVKQSSFLSVSAFLAVLAVTLLYSGDILIVKRLFSPELAGEYAGITTVARIIFFASASFAGVMIANVGKGNDIKKNRRNLVRTLQLTVLIGAPALLIFSLFPDFILTLLLGGKYTSLSYLLGKVSIVVLVASIANVLFYYLLAIRSASVIGVAMFTLLSIPLLLPLFSQNVNQIANMFLIVSTATLVLLVAIVLYNYKRSLEVKWLK